MWQNWLSGILGLWVVIIPFLNFSLAWQRTVLIFSGIIIAIFGFWSFYDRRTAPNETGQVKPEEKKIEI